MQNAEADEDETDDDVDHDSSVSLLQDAQRFDDTHKDTPEETFSQEWPTINETKSSEAQSKPLTTVPKSVVSKMKDSKIVQYMIKKRKPSTSPPKEKGPKQKKDTPSVEGSETSHPHKVLELTGKYDSGTTEQEARDSNHAPT